MFIFCLPPREHKPLWTGTLSALSYHYIPGPGRTPCTLYAFDKCLLNEWNGTRCKWVKRVFSLQSFTHLLGTSCIIHWYNPPAYMSSPALFIAAKSPSGPQGSSTCDTGKGEEKNEESKIGLSLFLTDKTKGYENKINSILSSPGNPETDQQGVSWVSPRKAPA